jgi:glycosyltransferase involved in cell wall biosynthesis
MLAVVIPTRGDRAKFLDFALRQILRQTKQPDIIEIVDYPPRSNDKDITERYSYGIQNAVKKGAECIIFWEDDDYYQPDYIAYMYAEWLQHGKPNLLGIDYTYYYHIGVKGLHYQTHEKRASMFCSMVSNNVIDFPMPANNYAFADLFIWSKWGGVTVRPERIMAIGIKHGIGLSGGSGHSRTNIYTPNEIFLKQHCTPEAYEFYQSI